MGFQDNQLRSHSNHTYTRQTTVLNGATASDIVLLKGTRLRRIITPTPFTDGAADIASLTFDVGQDEDNMNPLYDDTGTEYSVAVGPGRDTGINHELFKSASHIRVKTSAAPNADATLTLICIPQDE